MNKLQHLVEALSHLSEVDGFGLECYRIKAVIQQALEEKTESLEGSAFIDRLSDEELAIAIRIKDPRLELYFGPHICPFMFNYIRSKRPSVAAVEFSRKR
jgi:hypothetical protein